MDKSTTWLRISFRVGAIADGLAALTMFSEMIIGHASPLTHHAPDIHYRYAIGLAGSLMLGWSALLLWADRKPLERRGVLPLTCFVVIALMGTDVFAILTGHLPSNSGVPLLLLQGILIVLFTSSYVNSIRLHPS